jgi:hypothetical protein
MNIRDLAFFAEFADVGSNQWVVSMVNPREEMMLNLPTY